MSFLYIYNTIATATSSVSTSINHFSMIVITKACVVFGNIYAFCIPKIKAQFVEFYDNRWKIELLKYESKVK